MFYLTSKKTKKHPVDFTHNPHFAPVEGERLRWPGVSAPRDCDLFGTAVFAGAENTRPEDPTKVPKISQESKNGNLKALRLDESMKSPPNLDGYLLVCGEGVMHI